MNRIREFRKARGLKQNDLADPLGIDVTQISRMERGNASISVDRLQQIATILKVAPSDLLSATAELPEPQPATSKVDGPTPTRGDEDLPVWGTVLGAPREIDGEAIEQTNLNSGETVHHVRRPAALDGREDAYCLYVQGHSMEPAHMSGDLVLVEAKRPPRIGDDVVVYLRAAGEEDDGARARAVLIKRLARRTATHIELEQFNPAKTFRLDLPDIVRIDRVMRMADLLR